MRQFVVPQFIDVEDRIIGPITVRQFVMLMVAGAIEFSLYRFTDFYTFLIIGVPVAAVVVVVAFVPVNGRPIHFFLLNIVETLKRPRLRIWDKSPDVSYVRALLKQEREARQAGAKETFVQKAPIQKSRLAEVSLIVDTGGMYAGEERK